VNPKVRTVYECCDHAVLGCAGSENKPNLPPQLSRNHFQALNCYVKSDYEHSDIGRYRKCCKKKSPTKRHLPSRLYGKPFSVSTKFE